MPEGPEIRIMSEFINRVSLNQKFDRIEISPVYRYQLPNYPNFTLSSSFRGKELQILIRGKDSYIFNMGMSGYWIFTKNGDEPKHTVRI